MATARQRICKTFRMIKHLKVKQSVLTNDLLRVTKQRLKNRLDKNKATISRNVATTNWKTGLVIDTTMIVNNITVVDDK